MAPTGLAGFALVVNGVEQTPLSCPAESFEYPPPPAQGENPLCSSTPCPGLTVFLVNTGEYPVAYTAETTWPGMLQPPGVAFGYTDELSGVMNPGEAVNITSVYTGGIVAMLGSSHPFTDGSRYIADGTTIAWPAGVAGSGGSSEMNVAEIEIFDACSQPSVAW
jgi:hypothetical protein